MNQCPSTFFTAQCQLPATHTGEHQTSTEHDGATHITLWTTHAADEAHP